MNIRPVFRCNQLISRAFSSKSKTGSTIKINTTPNTQPPLEKIDVAGLSSKCVKPKSEPLGPGASTKGEYKVPEYFCYDKTSYAEAEIEMAKFRCPQPSAV